jgi:hypothetical protein
MSIVAGLFRQVAPGLIDNLEAQGLFKGVSRSTPSLTPEMFIGGEGISNLGRQGLVDADALTATMAKAEEDWFKIPSEEWNKMYGSSGLAIDPVAGKAMLEISDKNVAVQKGVDLNTLPENEFLGFDEVFKADTLKKAYPSMADIKVGFVDDRASPRLAAFDPASDSILFNRQHPEWRSKGNDPVKTALHEVQHYVQGRELFTGGESFTGVLQASQPYQESLKQLDSLVATSTKEVMRFAKENKKLGFTLDNVQDAVTALVKRDGLSVDTALTKAFAGRKNLAETMLVAAQQYPQLAQIINAKQMNSDALKQAQADYMRVAGETFARQTEQRRGMSADERMAMPAMRAINTDPTNKKFGINTENLTAPTLATQAPQQQAFADPFAMQIPQSTIPEGM